MDRIKSTALFVLASVFALAIIGFFATFGLAVIGGFAILGTVGMAVAWISGVFSRTSDSAT